LSVNVMLSIIAPNGLGIGEEGEFEKRQLGFCTKAKQNYKC
jgi:hypothetical protein